MINNLFTYPEENTYFLAGFKKIMRVKLMIIDLDFSVEYTVHESKNSYDELEEQYNGMESIPMFFYQSQKLAGVIINLYPIPDREYELIIEGN